MPPTRVQKPTGIMPAARRPISTRTHKNIDESVPLIGKRKAEGSPVKNDKVKRSALGNLTNAVLNYIDDSKKNGSQKVQALKKTVLSSNIQKQSNNHLFNGNAKPNAIEKLFSAPNAVSTSQPQRQTKIMTRAASRAAQPSSRHQVVNDENCVNGVGTKKIATTAAKTKKQTENLLVVQNTVKNDKRTNGSNGSNGKRTSRRISNEFDLNENEDSHYVSALEDL